MGSNLVRTLLDAGLEVSCTKRATSRTDHLDDLDIRWVEADLGAPDALREAFDGAQLVFHCAAATSIVRHVEPWLVEANVDGTRNVLEAAREAGVERVVHCSSTVAVGVSTTGHPCDEASGWNLPQHGLDDGYATTKRQAEGVVGRAVAAGQDVVIVNPGFMFGPYDVRPTSGQMIVEVATRRLMPYSAGSNSFVDVRDVCAGMLAAARKGQSGQRYILAGENLPYREIFTRIADVVGAGRPWLAVPRPAAALAGLAGDLWERVGGGGSGAGINSNTVAWGYCAGFVFRSDKAERELGYTRRPVEEGIRDAWAWMVQQGTVSPR